MPNTAKIKQKRTYSKALKAECIEMYVGLGMTSVEIGKKMNVPSCTVCKWVETLWLGKAQVKYGYTRYLTMKTVIWEN